MSSFSENYNDIFAIFERIAFHNTIVSNGVKETNKENEIIIDNSSEDRSIVVVGYSARNRIRMVRTA